MQLETLENFLHTKGKTLPSPLAVIFAEDTVELAGTIAHHRTLGFGTILVVGELGELDPGITKDVHVFPSDLDTLEDSVAILNQIIKACENAWIYYCFNAEYLFFPYCENRAIKDAIAFMEEERRTSVFTYAIDLYPQNMNDHPNGVDLATAHLDSNGYYGLNRFEDAEELERQTDIFGGLRWRFEEHIPWKKRRIDRISLFKALKGVKIDTDLRLNTPEMNTIACPWHNNMTMSIMSFRVAKALMHNPGSADEIHTFEWAGSQKFDWNSAQLLEMGFMEPGQWF
ncbi:MAG: hypothetical protein V3V13_00195 [Paracoccaceae bacterium]